MILKRTFFTPVLTGGLALVLGVGAAQAADPALLRMVTSDARMVAGIDIDRAKNSPFGQKILGEMKEEDAGFQRFVASTGFDPRRDLREVVVASSGAPKAGGSAVVLVRGSFDQSKIGQFLRGEGGVASAYRGVEMWKSGRDQGGDSVVAFLNPSLAVFGKDAAVRAAIDRSQQGGAGMDAELAARVSQWSAGNDAWFVSTASLAEMGVGKSGNNAILPGGLTVDAIRQAIGGVRFGNVVEVTGELTARSPQDATALADVFRFIASMVRLNADKPGMEDAQKLVDSLQVTTAGNAMKFSLPVTEEQLQKILDAKRKPHARAATQR